MTDEANYIAQAPWADVGVRAEEGWDGPTLRDHAGMGFHVLDKNLFYANDVTGRSEQVQRSKVLVRGDTGQELAIMGRDYQVVQWDDAFQALDVLVQKGKARYVAAGLLDDGRQGYMLARLPGEVRIGKTDDVVEKYVLFATSHDGSLANHPTLMPLRTWSQTMLPAGLKHAMLRVSILHTPSAELKLAEATKLLGQLIRQYDDFDQLANRLAKTKWTKAQQQRLAEVLFPPKAGEHQGPRRGRQTGWARDKVVELFESGNPLTPGTAWAGLNGAMEFVDHYRSTRVADRASADEAKVREVRLASVWFGKSARLKHHALEFITKESS